MKTAMDRRTWPALFNLAADLAAGLLTLAGLAALLDGAPVAFILLALVASCCRAARYDGARFADK